MQLMATLLATMRAQNDKIAMLTCYDASFAVVLEAAQGGVQGTVRNAPEGAEGLAETLLQLVAVDRRLLQVAQDGEFEHGVLAGRPGGGGPPVPGRGDGGALRCIETIHR